MKIRSYPLLARCIEEGIAYGWTRAHKHTNTPDENILKTEIEQAILNEISEFFTFDDERNGEDIAL